MRTLADADITSIGDPVLVLGLPSASFHPCLAGQQLQSSPLSRCFSTSHQIFKDAWDRSLSVFYGERLNPGLTLPAAAHLSPFLCLFLSAASAAGRGHALQVAHPSVPSTAVPLLASGFGCQSADSNPQLLLRPWQCGPGCTEALLVSSCLVASLASGPVAALPLLAQTPLTVAFGSRPP